MQRTEDYGHRRRETEDNGHRRRETEDDEMEDKVKDMAYEEDNGR